ncbi:Uncharacterised protein [Nocardia otitidiscaviarum]|uniref:Uncharacterized protein n=1 Tax=Nocardia otitidiscaviarum TaxID=1823 RepID=A0A378YC93_9NOCA|nr:Uncharacterised protein [Nocardia otitidiscaviarum]
MTCDNPWEILQKVARFAATAVGTGDRLYCWHFLNG